MSDIQGTFFLLAFLAIRGASFERNILQCSVHYRIRYIVLNIQ